MSEIVRTAGAELVALAEQINDHQRACEQAVSAALAHAIDAGEWLTEAKSRLGHGSFGPWLRENFAGSDRTGCLTWRRT
jgi:hypothetical protein